MKKTAFLISTLCCLIVFSIACGGSSNSSDGPETITSDTQLTASATATPNSKPLSLIWTEPCKEVFIAQDQEVFLNFRGVGTEDQTATIYVGVDNDTVESNGVVQWFDRTYSGGHFLVTISASDLPAGTYYFIAKISRAGDTISKYMEEPLSILSQGSITVSLPAVETLATWGTAYAFQGANGSGSSDNVRILLDSDRNPSNGFCAQVTSGVAEGNFQEFWNVDDALTGKYYVCLNTHTSTSEEYSYAPGWLLIGDNPAVDFSSPLNDINVHAAPAVEINVTGSASSSDVAPSFRIGYDTDLDPSNGGITWLFTELEMGSFDFVWDVSIAASGTYYLVGEVSDQYGTGYGYSPGAIIVDGSSYIEIHEPLTDVTTIAGEFLPLFITGYGYSTYGDSELIIFYDNDNSTVNGYETIDTISEGAMNSFMDVSSLAPGEYHIGVILRRGYLILVTKWSPMTLTVTPNTDISTPENSGPNYILSSSYNEYDDENAKNVRFEIYYPTASYDTTGIKPDTVFPVVFFIPHQYTSYTSYTNLTETLARWGYVVVAINTLYNTGWGSTGPRKDMTDAIFILNWLTAQNEDPASDYYGSLNLSAVGIGGHGRGGGAAIAASHTDERFTAVFGLSSLSYDDEEGNSYKAQAPLLLFGASASTSLPVSTQEGIYDDADSFAELAILEGANGLQYKDSVTQYEHDGSPTMSIEEQHLRVSAMTVAFLNVHLKNQSYFQTWINGDGVAELGKVSFEYK